MSETEQYVAAMSDIELADLLDVGCRHEQGRCVSPRILRAAEVEREARAGRDSEADDQ